MAEQTASPMPTAELAVRTIFFAGKERHIAYPITSIFALEDKAGINLTAPGPAHTHPHDLKRPPDPYVADCPGCEQLQLVEGRTPREKLERDLQFLWAGLLWETPTLSYEEVARWVHFGNLKGVREVCTAAYLGNFKPREEQDAGVSQADPLLAQSA